MPRTLLFFCLCLPLLATAQRKVLIIGIDGCRGDAIVAADTPVLDGLRNGGYQTIQGNTHPPTWSGTGWSSMLTGVWEQKHKVVDNTFGGNQFATWPHFFARLSAVDPTLDLRSFSHWAPINTAICTGADQELDLATDQAVADAAVAILTTGDPDVLFLQFDDVDHAGHEFGTTTTTPGYLAAIEVVDAQLAPVIAAVQARPAEEEWLVYVTADHGGNAGGHGGITFDEQRIFVFINAPGIAPAVELAHRDTLVMPPTIAFGAGRHVRVADPTPYRFGTSTDFTIECRVRMPATWTDDPVFVGDKNWNSGVNKGFVLSTTATGGTWKFNIGDGTDRVDLTGLPINDDQWHHIAVTCDRDGEARIFQDGLLLRSVGMALIGDVDAGLQLCFGQDGTTAYGTALTGRVAGVRIWDMALPINTVSAWSGRTLDPTHPAYASLIGHWPMGEGGGGVVANTVAGAPPAQHFTNASATSATWTAGGARCIATDLTLTPTQVDLVPTVLAHLCIANGPAWQLDGRSRIPVCAPVQVNARTFLEGPFAAADGLMRDDLRVNGLVPPVEPFTGQGPGHAGLGGGETLLPGALDAAGPDAVVDWVLLEARDAQDPSHIVSTRACLVQRDGDIVDVDGSSPVVWRTLLGPYHMAVRHRNHLGVMTAAARTFDQSGSVAVDFTDPATAVHGTQAMHVVDGVRVQWCGNVLPDASVRYTGAVNDRDPILQAIGGTVPTATTAGYLSTDVNMDGIIKYTGTDNDRDPILQTIGGTVPTAVRAEQLP